MGFFGSLFEKPRTPAQLATTFDLERGTVCELGRGDTRETITQRLGRPTRVEEDTIYFDQIGLYFCVTKTGRVTQWCILFDPVDPEGRSRWRWSNGTAETMTVANFVALFGEPTKVETDELAVEAGGPPVIYVSRTWERPDVHVIVEHDKDGLDSVRVDFDV